MPAGGPPGSTMNAVINRMCMRGMVPWFQPDAASDAAAIRSPRLGAAAAGRAGPHGVRGLGAAGLRHAVPHLRPARPQGGVLHRRVAPLLRPDPLAVAAGLPEGHLVEPAVRGAGPRLRLRPAHRALFSTAGRLPPFPAPGDDQALAARPPAHA